ncbi:uL15m family ribosomal protein [Haloglomus salinum]|jgi:large subunit ribosomal protein L15|uniref:uL15m family ribosomal protein n=1 Tax=Haloglomus salinum TaxID=2962673 RepID=UPI0020C96AFA|nr:uL15m family ribosomal protein [Haloglomus salinum]
MTSKKRRQRGSRTHGGGSHKKRRGAGHRGGRGRAGRDKHEQYLYPPLGKSGFKRPQKVQEDIETINVRELDEDAVVLAAEGVAEETGDGYEVDVRDVVEDGHEADAVKVLAGGQVHESLTVHADAFSDDAREAIEAAGGEAVLTERGEERAAENEAEDAEGDTTDEANED